MDLLYLNTILMEQDFIQNMPDLLNNAGYGEFLALEEVFKNSMENDSTKCCASGTCD